MGSASDQADHRHRNCWQDGTADSDGWVTKLVSRQQNVLNTYDGQVSCMCPLTGAVQPMLALWAEADLIVADQFRDGNVPAKQEPLSCWQMAFAALPESVTTRYFRGDSACYESNLLDWLSSPERAREQGGGIGFAISAVMSQPLAQTIAALPEAEWTTFATEPDGTQRQWAKVVYVPSKKSEHKHSQPLRYVGLRLLKAQGVLFADGSDRHHHAVVTNLDWDTPRLLQWHREKAGIVEHAHDELKNGVAAGHMPSQRFAINATWLKLAILSYNIASAIKGLCFSPEERTARFKKYRLLWCTSPDAWTATTARCGSGCVHPSRPSRAWVRYGRCLISPPKLRARSPGRGWHSGSRAAAFLFQPLNPVTSTTAGTATRRELAFLRP